MLALLRSDRQVIMAQARPLKNNLLLFSSSGSLLVEHKVDHGARIIEFGWDMKDQLVAIMDDGNVRIYDIYGNVTQFSLGMPNIIAARFWESGFAALTSTLELIFVDNIDVHGLRQSEITLPDLPDAWAVISPHHARGKQTEVLFALGGTCYLSDGFTVQECIQMDGPVSELTVSPNGNFVAFYGNGKLTVTPIDFKQKLLEFPAKTKSLPSQICWCGNDSVLLYWDQVLLMVGPYGDWIKYSFATRSHTEVDGARLITKDQCEFLERVPDSTEEIFKIGSTKPAALLYDAWQNFERRDARADDIVRTIDTSLLEAVLTCINAAAHELEPKTQKSLLRAASFGRAFLDQNTTDEYVTVCKNLRTLNALRHHDVGLAITYRQFEQMSIETIIDLLLRRQKHYLALEIAKYYGLSSSKILIDWACLKMKNTSLLDEQLSAVITERLMHVKHSFAKVSEAAYLNGRPNLAALLIEHENRLADQIPLLLSMQEYTTALSKAILSGDADLVYFVILYLRRKMNLPDFFRIVASQPASSALLECFYRKRSPDFLKDFYYQEDKRLQSALFSLQQGHLVRDQTEKLNHFKAAFRIIKDEKQLIPYAKLIDETSHLVSVQSQLETDSRQPFVGLTLNETIIKLEQLGQSSTLNKIKNDFHIPEKRLWHLKVRAYGETRDFEGLERLSKSKKPPIGYEPFIQVCVKHGNQHEAKKYILRCDNSRRPDLYFGIGAFIEAADAAFATKNIQVLQKIFLQQKNTPLGLDVQKRLQELGYKIQ